MLAEVSEISPLYLWSINCACCLKLNMSFLPFCPQPDIAAVRPLMIF